MSCAQILLNFVTSLPMRGEWIEINIISCLRFVCVGLSPCGESGLKFPLLSEILKKSASLPMRGEWIEIQKRRVKHGKNSVSPHAGRVD